MRKLVIVTSSIRPREGSFTYSEKRSFFSAEERFRQTLFTVNSLRNSLPDCDIVIVDSSEDYAEYANVFRFFPKVTFVPLKELSVEACEKVNTHANKSYCESLLLDTYFKQHKKQIKEYDFLFKMSGRYFCFNFNDSLLTEENKNKIFFKPPLQFEWHDEWGYQFIDRRHIENNNLLKQYCTVLYGYGIEHFDKFLDINEAVLHFTNLPTMYYYDIELLYYYFLRHYEKHILHTNWLVSGWTGVSGEYMYY